MFCGCGEIAPPSCNTVHHPPMEKKKKKKELDVHDGGVTVTA